MTKNNLLEIELDFFVLIEYFDGVYAPAVGFLYSRFEHKGFPYYVLLN